MKIYNINDIDSFFDEVKNCTGDVYLETDEGDRLNLKSQLTKYVALANIFSNGCISELELILTEPSDVNRLLKYLVMGHGLSQDF